jgi:hypothetical protein
MVSEPDRFSGQIARVSRQRGRVARSERSERSERMRIAKNNGPEKREAR